MTACRAEGKRRPPRGVLSRAAGRIRMLIAREGRRPAATAQRRRSTSRRLGADPLGDLLVAQAPPQADRKDAAVLLDDVLAMLLGTGIGIVRAEHVAIVAPFTGPGVLNRIFAACRGEFVSCMRVSRSVVR